MHESADLGLAKGRRDKLPARAALAAAGVALSLLALVGCVPLLGASDSYESAVDKLETERPSRLAFNTPGGVYTAEQRVSMEIVNIDHEPEAIYYTTDNTTPTSSSQRYTEPLTVSRTQFIRAKAVFAEETGEPDAFAADLYVIADELAMPDDHGYAEQWHYGAISMPQAWTILVDDYLRDPTRGAVLQPGTAPIRIAVLDTGYRAHPDLRENITHGSHGAGGGGWDFVENNCDPTDPRLDSHGTHVSGTVAAVSNNKDGVAGIGWDGDNTESNSHLAVVPVRVLDTDGVGTTADIAEGIRYAAGLENASGTTPDPVHVINLSLGGPGRPNDKALYDAIQSAVEQGITVIAAAGNNGAEDDTAVLYPANFDNTIAISATTSENVLAGYSSFGWEVDFAAPGGSAHHPVWSTTGDSGYAGLIGTSMAAPHVTGVVGLLYAYEPRLTQADIYAILKRSANRLSTNGRTKEFGWGLIDAEAALRTLFTHGHTEAWASGTSTTALSSQHRGVRPQGSNEIDWENAEYEPNTLLVRFRDDGGEPAAWPQRRSSAAELGRAYGLTSVHARGRTAVARVAPQRSLPDVARELARDPRVEHVQPNYIYRAVR